MLTLPAPIPDKEKNITEIFIFTLLCGASKGFMKTLKKLSEMNGAGRVNQHRLFSFDKSGYNEYIVKANPLISLLSTILSYRNFEDI